MDRDVITLRRARPDDAEFAFRVRRAALGPYVESSSGWDEAEQRALHERRFAEQDFRVVQVAGTPVGILALGVAPDCVKLNQILVLPGHQGRGVGRECMRHVEEDARRRGLPVRLRVMKVNPRALAFYERLGYARIGETGTHHRLEKIVTPR